MPSQTPSPENSDLDVTSSARVTKASSMFEPSTDDVSMYLMSWKFANRVACGFLVEMLTVMMVMMHGLAEPAKQIDGWVVDNFLKLIHA